MSNKPLRKHIKNWLIYQFIRILVWTTRRLPRTLAWWLFRHLGLLIFVLLRDAREKTIRHLRLAFGNQRSDDEIHQLARQVFRQLGLNAADAVRIPNLRKAGLHKFIRFVGREHLDRAFQRGKGVLCLTGHIGCWELLGAWIAAHYPLKVVGATLYDPRLDAILLQERETAGYQSLPRDASGTRQILRWMKQGGLLGMLIDQDTTRVDGEFVDFLGQLAYTPAGPVVIAERTGAALVPMAIYMNDDGTHTVEVRPEIKLQNTGNARVDRIRNVEMCSKAVEAFIREHPTQWVWMHERWKTQPNEKRDSPKE
ncbi:MAG: lysophospholipid acyltransferase family protein [candidate division KSB1 bacterium]|nr:lysophospholipid acyltransferase family protein [candidate division KSB1 bacterium]MDZ7301646.1 lysophospholipid acyltransferase family protein [candidate division KSB1 bacterium]MDZ7313493.1 lysophospholipid acyltransferase family protein [candidate division KSB1 bacterium]